MNIAMLIAERMTWARTLKDPEQTKAWLDFYAKIFATNEGRAHLEWILDGKRAPYLQWIDAHR